MNVSRGDVVLVDFPYPSGTGRKVRPALVIQNNRDNQRLLNTIVAQITSTTHRAIEATQVLVEVNTPEGKQAGIRSDSVVNCANVVTLSKARVIAKIGDLPHASMLRVKESLKVAMELH